MYMNYTSLKPYEKITQENSGNIIRSNTWNTNFNRVSSVISDNNSIIEKNFSDINALTIPCDVLEDNDGSLNSNVYKELITLLSYAKTKVDIDDFNIANNNNIKNIEYERSTGKFTITYGSGEQEVFDTLLEKIPVKMELVDEDEYTYLVIINDDGTTSKTDVTKLLNVYKFINSDTIVPAYTDDYTVSFSVQSNSISSEHIKQEVWQQFENYMTNTEKASQIAEAYKTEATRQASSALEYKNQSNSFALDSKNYSENSGASATLSESWAVGNTNTRSGENTDNSKYYSEVAKIRANNALNYANAAQGYVTDASNEVARASNEADRAEAAESRAEQMAATLGYVQCSINESGHIILERTDNVDLDLELKNGRLIQIWQ